MDMIGMGDVVFRATERTSPVRRVHDGKVVVYMTDRYGREPHEDICRAAGKAPEDMMRFGVSFADGSGCWASAREIGRA